MITDAGFDSEAPRDPIAKGPDHPVNFLWLSQQSAARAFSANRRTRAAEVEIDSRDRVMLQLPDRIDHMRRFGTDDLRKDRPAGAVFIDRAENVAIRPERVVNAEELGDKPIGSAASSANPHERKVRDALHRRQNQGGSIMRKEVAHADESLSCRRIEDRIRASPEMTGNPRLIWRG